jgi:hypothetical protein
MEIQQRDVFHTFVNKSFNTFLGKDCVIAFGPAGVAALAGFVSGCLETRVGLSRFSHYSFCF